MTNDSKKYSTSDFLEQPGRVFSRFEAGDDTYEARMLRLAAENGVDFCGKTVLDVGCGSGMYTIRLAQQAALVTALDISEEMLRILMQDAAAQGLANIHPVLSDWQALCPCRTLSDCLCFHDSRPYRRCRPRKAACLCA